jgi:3-isopropylmalate/(R)-2-methylmalate dehydratase large subunit
LTFVQKALARAAGVESAEVGQILDVRPNIALSHDNTAPIRKIWQRLGQDRVAIPERMAFTMDHAVPAPTPRHAQNHQEARDFAAEQGVSNVFEVGRGICHQVLSEEALVLPGQVILGSDSHTPHFGWMGAFGAGVGRSEMAVIWATGEMWLRVPESMKVTITGELQPWVTSKDLALHLIGRLGADGGLYRSVEFHGDGLEQMSIESRMALTNMMAEFGAKNSYSPADEKVVEWLTPRLAARKDISETEAREEIRDSILAPDEDADYVEEVLINASEVGQQVACPHTVDRTADVGELSTIKVDQAFLGTCTNGRIEDLREASRVLKGKKIAKGTRLLVIPASSEVMNQALSEGLIQDFTEAGAMIGVPGCGPCMGNHSGVLAPGETCISSANRNFKGRMGTPEADIYLASPAVVAASSVLGRVAAPQEVVS